MSPKNKHGKLLSIGSDHKTVKGEAHGYLTAIMYLAPAKSAGGRDMCPHRSPECTRLCLGITSGLMVTPNVQKAHIEKTRFFLTDPKAFVEQLCNEIGAFVKRAKRKNMAPCVRLNGTSDIQWEKYGIFERFPNVRFYDYTKFPVRHRTIPRNYHLTFSNSEKDHSQMWSEEWYGAGVNTAVVFQDELPATFRGRRVVDGDKSDLRFLDDLDVIVGLSAKGSAKRAQTGGFVQ